MAYFRYKLIDKDGRVRGGWVELPFQNPVSAMTYLEKKGSTVLFVEAIPPVLAGLFGAVMEFFATPVTKAELAEALNNVAVMLSAGIPLLTALKDAMGEHDNPTLARLGNEIAMRVEGGVSLTEAVKMYPQHFPGAMVFLVKLGEESGNLDRTLKDAGDHVKRVDRIMKDTKSAMIYPAFMFTAIFGAMAFWLVVVAPVLSELFRQAELKLPWFTVAVIHASDFLKDYILMIMVAIFVLYRLLKLANDIHKPTRRFFHRLWLKIPVIKMIIQSFNLAFITEYLSLMLQSGVDIFKSLDTMSQNLKNEIYKEKLAQVRSHLVQGNGLRDSFHEARIFPSFVVRMIGVGEQSGTLSDQLNYVAEDYRIKLELLVANIAKIIEPVALAVGGGLFIAIIIALFAPVYQLVSKMGGG
ncbi:MAG: type II secretion system F family protein [Magnetococcales bacterium]|nr:type II secretion system F family protein [Magnetococcales bacterium]MBF0321465.1 type II secretion system F family protein [Magnetococcales bacterium]